MTGFNTLDPLVNLHEPIAGSMPKLSSCASGSNTTSSAVLRAVQDHGPGPRHSEKHQDSKRRAAHLSRCKAFHTIPCHSVPLTGLRNGRPAEQDLQEWRGRHRPNPSVVFHHWFGVASCFEKK